MAKHTVAQASDGRASLRVTQTDTDAPLLPVQQLEALHRFAPDKVTWVFEQTAIEADLRRKRIPLIDRVTIIERLGGLQSAFLVMAGCIVSATYLAMHGHESTASVIGGTALVAAIGYAVQSLRKAR